MSFLPQSRSVCAFLLFAYSVLLTVTAEAAPKRLICEAETGKAAARYWSEQAARNRAYGKTKQTEQMERTAAFCEDAAFSRQIAIHFDDTDTLLGTEQLADFEMQTLCGLERGESAGKNQNQRVRLPSVFLSSNPQSYAILQHRPKHPSWRLR